MHRILSAMLAAASCATMTQAQVGPSAPFAHDAPVYTLDQAVSAAGGSAPAAEPAHAAVDAARASRPVRPDAPRVGEECVRTFSSRWPPYPVKNNKQEQP